MLGVVLLTNLCDTCIFRRVGAWNKMFTLCDAAPNPLFYLDVEGNVRVQGFYNPLPNATNTSTHIFNKNAFQYDAYRPLQWPSRLWTEFLTHACENITFPQLLLRTVKMRLHTYVLSV